MLISKCSVTSYSHVWQAKVLSIISESFFNTTQVSTTWFGLEAFIELENAEYFMLLQWIDKFGIPAIIWTPQWKEVERRKLEFGFTYDFLDNITVNS